MEGTGVRLEADLEGAKPRKVFRRQLGAGPSAVQNALMAAEIGVMVERVFVDDVPVVIAGEENLRGV